MNIDIKKDGNYLFPIIGLDIALCGLNLALHKWEVAACYAALAITFYGWRNSIKHGDKLFALVMKQQDCVVTQNEAMMKLATVFGLPEGAALSKIEIERIEVFEPVKKPDTTH